MNLTLSILLVVATADQAWPARDWVHVTPAKAGMDASLLRQARDYALTGGGSGCITRGGRLVIAWGDPARKYDLKSTTKSIGVTALGLALTDGKMKLSDKAVRYHPSLGTPPPENADTGWLDEITLLHLATQTAGFAKPGGYERLLFQPGTAWHYSDGGPNWLAECLTLLYRRDIQELMFERVFTPIGIERSDLRWRPNQYRPHEIEGIPRREFGSGVHANVDAMARIGLLYLRKGCWRDKRILDPRFVEAAATTVPQVVGLPEHDPKHYGNASDHYGLLWWNNRDGTLAGVPRDAFWSWGLYDSLILVVPSLDIVAARAGRSWRRSGGGHWTGGGHYDVLRPFFQPIVASVGDREASADSPGGRSDEAGHPPSPVIARLAWAPPEQIVRRAQGSDNWPTTWGDDDRLYTAYGDGWGFEPKVPVKLSLGFAAIEGPPGNFRGRNIRSPSGECRGDGPQGKKASGILMVGGVLYLCARNAGNAQIAHSADHGRRWTWCDWRFTTSFGCPTFLHFGRDHAGARDQYVYLYSPDSPGAYEPADRMVLARVPRDRITQREAYEFFQRRDASGKPCWTKQIERRGGVFERPGRCGRSIVSFDAPLGRYLWVQVFSSPGKASEPGGLAVYDATQPWGPWTTVFDQPRWDVSPGETAGFPTKWISADGRTLYLVFSGGDCFAVRKVELELAGR